jgi:uncharacterized protein YjdB
MKTTEIAGDHVFRTRFAAAMADAVTDDEVVAFVAPFNLTITGVDWTPDAAVTANGTNYSAVSVRNRKADSSGSVLPASRSYAATNSAARVKEAMTLSSTAADLNVAAGDVITLQRIHTASGVIVPAGVVEIKAKVR